VALTERLLGEDMLPHSGPARLVEAVLEVKEDRLTCRGRVPGASAFAAGGRVPAVALVEMAAQAVAVHRALRLGVEPSGAASVRRSGYLVAIRSASLAADDVATDVPLVVDARRTLQAGPLVTYEVRVSGPGSEALLTATLSLHAGG
jgi:predicted hotdog family 3-hydroxylacyl-ACP dehydratase